MLLKLDRERLAPNLIPNEVALEEVRRGAWLRHVEVWYPEPIPFSCVTACVLVLPSQSINFSVYNSDRATLEELDFALDNLVNESQYRLQ